MRTASGDRRPGLKDRPAAEESRVRRHESASIGNNKGVQNAEHAGNSSLRGSEEARRRPPYRDRAGAARTFSRKKGKA
jgi:hypothetical protein